MESQKKTLLKSTPRTLTRRSRGELLKIHSEKPEKVIVVMKWKLSVRKSIQLLTKHYKKTKLLNTTKEKKASRL